MLSLAQVMNSGVWERKCGMKRRAVGEQAVQGRERHGRGMQVRNGDGGTGIATHEMVVVIEVEALDMVNVRLADVRGGAEGSGPIPEPMAMKRKLM
jgi:hypothetical protein